jgi:hypothetical protein
VHSGDLGYDEIAPEEANNDHRRAVGAWGSGRAAGGAGSRLRVFTLVLFGYCKWTGQFGRGCVPPVSFSCRCDTLLPGARTRRGCGEPQLLRGTDAHAWRTVRIGRAPGRHATGERRTSLELGGSPTSAKNLWPDP